MSTKTACSHDVAIPHKIYCVNVGTSQYPSLLPLLTSEKKKARLEKPHSLLCHWPLPMHRGEVDLCLPTNNPLHAGKPLSEAITAVTNILEKSDHQHGGVVAAVVNAPGAGKTSALFAVSFYSVLTEKKCRADTFVVIQGGSQAMVLLCGSYSYTHLWSWVFFPSSHRIIITSTKSGLGCA